MSVASDECSYQLNIPSEMGNPPPLKNNLNQISGFPFITKNIFFKMAIQSAILDPATPKINRVLPFQVVHVTQISNRYGEQFMSYRTHSYKC